LSYCPVMVAAVS